MYRIHRIASQAQVELKIGFVAVSTDFNRQDFELYRNVDSSFQAVLDEIRDSCELSIGITQLLIADDETKISSASVAGRQ